MKKITSFLTMLALTLVMALSLFTSEAKAYSGTIDYTRAVYYVSTFEELKAACEATSYDRTIILKNDIKVGYEDFVSAGSADNYMKDYQITIKGDTAVLIDLNGFNYSVLSRNTNFVFAVRENATVHFINSHPTLLSSIKFDVNNNPVHGGVGINYENTTSLVNVNTTGGFYSDNVSYLLGEFDLSEQAGDDKYITNNDKRVTNIFLQSAKEVVMHSGTVNNVYSGGRGIHINSASGSTPDFKVEISNMTVKSGGFAIASTCAKSLTLDYRVTLESTVTGQCMFTLSTGDAAKVANILGKDKLDNTPVVYSTDRYTTASSDTKIDNLGAKAYFIYEGNVMPDLSSIKHDTSMILPHGHVIRFDYSGMWCRLDSHDFTLDENGYAYCRCGHEEKYEVVLSKKSYTYDGTAKEPSVTLKVGGIEVPSGYYTVEYENNVNVGTATVKIKADKIVGVISGNTSTTFKIAPKAITPTVTLSNTSFTYNGKVQKPTVTVKDGSTTLAATNYTVTYASGCTNAGSYKVTVTLKGNYSGTATKTYTIKAKAITPTVTLSKTAYTYNGKVQKPTVTVKNGTTTLAATNYTVTYSSGCKNAGTYKVTVKLKGNYSGTATKTYTIKAKAVTPKVTLSKTTYTYNGKVQKPTVTVKNGSSKLTTASYTVTYASGRKNVGKYKVTVKLKGNYSGTATKTFTIKPKATSLSKLTAGTKKLTVTWKKLTTQTSGYQIQYSTSSSFKSPKTVTVSKNTTTKKTISNLKSGKKYYVRIRTYKTVKVNGKSTKIYSSWSKLKSVKVK